MRWERDGKYIEVCSGIGNTTDRDSAVSWIESNAFNGSLPVEWRETVPHSATEPAALISRIKAYAEANGFVAVKPSAPTQSGIF